MKFVNPLPFVADMGRATSFYREVLGLRVLKDHGAFVTFEGGFALHD
jgi:catechol 2,3-dioxygenase-like lactoylglutathione lyase family enzyme